MHLDIMVNGAPVDLEFEGPVQWQDLLGELERDLGGRGWEIRAIRVNGEPVMSEKDPFAADPDGSYSVAVQALPGRKTLRDIEDQLWATVPRFQTLAGEIAEVFSRGEWRQGLERLTPFLEDLQTAITGLQVTRNHAASADSDIHQRVQQCLKDLSKFIDRQSWVELSDLLIYELVPLLETWSKQGDTAD